MPPRIIVAITTLGRPRMLAEAIKACTRMTNKHGVDFGIVVVDNDASASAREVVEDIARSSAVPIAYVVEPRRGISEARNRALDYATEQGADYMGFCDDDAAPAPGWLDAVMATVETKGAHLTGGPVYFVLPDEALTRSQTRIAKAIAAAARRRAWRNLQISRSNPPVTIITNNWFADLNWLNQQQLRFDPRYSVSGGGDTEFFRRVVGRGGNAVWSHDAVMEEIVPASRLGLRYQFKRQIHSGMVKTAWFRREKGPARTMLTTLPKLVGNLSLGLALVVASAVGGISTFYPATRLVGKAIGQAAGVLGLEPEHYRTVQGY